MSHIIGLMGSRGINEGWGGLEGGGVIKSAGQKGRKLAAALSLKPNQAFMCPRKGGVAKEDEWQGKRWSQAVLIAHYLVANKPPILYIDSNAGT